VVVGDWDRNLYVHDAETGEMLFQTRLSSAIQGFPITYSVRGKQYLAIPVGMGSPRAVWATRILPEKKSAAPREWAVCICAARSRVFAGSEQVTTGRRMVKSLEKLKRLTVRLKNAPETSSPKSCK